MPPLIHILQISDVLDLELATAMAERLPVLAWEPERLLRPDRVVVGREAEHVHAGSTLRVRALPLLRGFARPPFALLDRYVIRSLPTVLDRLLAKTPDPANTPLLCTVPYFAEIAERWPGPVIYWLTDLIAEYSSADRAQVERLDRRMCRAATLVCPNSRRLADYLKTYADCDPEKLVIVPNATRAINILPEQPTAPGPRPEALAGIAGPIAGVIGNLAGNMDWLLLARLIEFTPTLAWVFVGPTTMHIADRRLRLAREAVIAHPRAQFIGRRPYGELAAYARAFEVAVLPYRRCEPTYSGSSTRFYEHLAACRPMIATPGLEELNHKTPLLTLVETAEEAAAVLVKLEARSFDDGLLRLRWQASLQSTWQTRARTILDGLEARKKAPPESHSSGSNIRAYKASYDERAS